MNTGEWVLLITVLGSAVVGAIAIAYDRGKKSAETAAQPSVEKRLADFLGSGVNQMPVVTRTYGLTDLPSFQLSLDRILTAAKSPPDRLSFNRRSYEGLQLKDLAAGEGAHGACPVTYRQCETGPDTSMSCLADGLVLLELEQRVAIMVTTGDGPFDKLTVEVLAPDLASASGLLERLHQGMLQVSVFRHKVVTLSAGAYGGGPGSVVFHDVPKIQRDEMILPEELLVKVERNAVQFLDHLDALRRCGRAVKRGLLFHGKPGTGKTFMVKYLAQVCRDLTTFYLTAENISLLGYTCRLARLLQPAMVVIEDVDLIARDRESNQYLPAMHQLLNEMDGAEGDAAILFVLTTNRPEVLEEALVSRPGRVDQAIEFPLPDEACRRRLLDLYARGLTVTGMDWTPVVQRTRGASAAFIKELMRKATLVALGHEGPPEQAPNITPGHLDEALRELLLAPDALTRRLIGFDDEARPRRAM